MAQLARKAHRSVLLAPPRQAKSFLRSIQCRAKTDRLDSEGLALFALSQALAPYPLKTPMQQHMDQLLQHMDQLLLARRGLARAAASLGQQIKELPHAKEPLAKALTEMKAQLKVLDGQIASLTQQPELSAAARLRKVPGIGPVTAAALASRLAGKQFSHPDKLVAYIGLDIGVQQSGRKKGERGLTKQGDAELRRLLFLCASASLLCKDTGFKSQYERERAKGLPSTAALCAVARKMAKVCWSIVQHGTHYDLLPSRQFVDAGYVDAAVLVSSREQHQIELFGPPRDGQSWQARAGGFDQGQFTLDWDKQQAICPEGKASTSWGSFFTKPYNQPIVKVRFLQSDCAACSSRDKCVRSPAGQSRTLVLPERSRYEALQQARTLIASEEGIREYKKRAGIEGLLSQGVRRSGLRQSRYLGLAKTHLQYLATAVSLNLVRGVNHLEARPLAKTRTSRFARLAV